MTKAETDANGLPGQVAIAFVGALLVLIGFAGLSVDAIGVWSLHQSQIDYLQGIQEMIMDAEEPIKYGIQASGTTTDSVDTAYELICRHVRDTAKNKHTFATRVTIYELPKDKTGPADRYIGIKLEAEATYDTVFASVLGVNDVPVKSHIETVVHPYAGTEVWRPSDTATSLTAELPWKVLPDGTRRLEPRVTGRTLDWDALDPDLKRALSTAVGGS